MTRIKLCGLTRPCDIEAANELRPDYIGFVFAPKSSRYVTPEQAKLLRRRLSPGIRAVGVFVREDPETVIRLIGRGVIDLAQLHGGEDEAYLARLRAVTGARLIQAFRIDTKEDVERAKRSPADYILLDAKTGGTGTVFDWSLIGGLDRPYFLAGGLDAGNVGEAVRGLRPYAVDVSSGIETDGRKDRVKMAEFVRIVREIGGKEERQ